MEALSIVASLFTIWAQSSILAENKEFDRFKEKDPQVEQQQIQEDEQEMRKRNQEIIEARLVVLTETRL